MGERGHSTGRWPDGSGIPPWPFIIVVCITAITTLGKNANNTFLTVGNAVGSAGS
jgi:hypothetical protein